MAKNDKRNDRSHLDGKRVKFTKDRQPSPEAKSRGWERRREAQKILDDFMRIGNMSFQELQELQDDIKLNPHKHTVREVKLAQYMSKEKFVTDWLDRHVSKAPTELDVRANITTSDIKDLFDDPDEGIEDE